MAATHSYFTLADSAQKLLPALCYLTTDPDKGVRDQVCSLFVGDRAFPVAAACTWNSLPQHVMSVSMSVF